MQDFIVRVQLLRGNSNSYTLLRDGLIGIGFSKRITDGDGIEWRLPNGNYRIRTDADRNAVIKAVQSVALNIDSSAMIFISAIAPKSAVWSGLQQC